MTTSDATGARDRGASDLLDRRGFLLSGSAALAWLGTGCSGTDDAATSTTGGATTASSTTSPSAAGAPAAPVAATTLSAADFEGLDTCQLLAAMPAGPFPTIDQLERRDITEGYPGHPMRLGFRVVDADCAPVPGAAVEVWHTDASGDYSSYEDGGTGKDEGTGTTFLRGFQVADGDGIVELITIFPGWYPGRAVHVHVRVRIDGDLVLTSQLFFPDDLTAEIIATDPYASFGAPDTTNATDGFGGDIATNGSLLHVARRSGGADDVTLVLANIGVGT